MEAVLLFLGVLLGFSTLVGGGALLVVLGVDVLVRAQSFVDVTGTVVPMGIVTIAMGLLFAGAGLLPVLSSTATWVRKHPKMLSALWLTTWWLCSLAAKRRWAWTLNYLPFVHAAIVFDCDVLGWEFRIGSLHVTYYKEEPGEPWIKEVAWNWRKLWRQYTLAEGNPNDPAEKKFLDNIVSVQEEAAFNKADALAKAAIEKYDDDIDYGDPCTRCNAKSEWECVMYCGRSDVDLVNESYEARKSAEILAELEA